MTTRRLSIGLDLDGVLADFTLRFTETMRGLYPENPWLPFSMRDERNTTYDFGGDTNGITEDMIQATWRAMEDELNWWETIPFLGTPDEMRRLADLTLEADVTVVTARKLSTRGRSLIAQTRRSLDGYGLSHVGLVVSGAKGTVAEGLHLDAFLDDQRSNLDNIASHCHFSLRDRPKLFLFDRPYNRTLADQGYTRMPSLSAFLDLLGPFVGGVAR